MPRITTHSNGAYICGLAGYQSPNTVGDNSCNYGEKDHDILVNQQYWTACKDIGGSLNAVVTIGNGSCNDCRACRFTGSANVGDDQNNNPDNTCPNPPY